MAIEKLHITHVTHTDKKKDGSEILSKFGKKSWKVGIKTNEYGDMWLNGFLPFCPDKWKDTVQEVEVYDDEWNGEVRKAFKLPPRNPGISESDKAEIAVARRDANAALMEVKLLRQDLEKAGVLAPRVATIPGTTKAYPTQEAKEVTFDRPIQEEPPLASYFDEPVNAEDIPY